MFYVLHCAILFFCFSVLLALRFSSLGEERSNLSVFQTFVRFALVWLCLFSLGVWERLRFVYCTDPVVYSTDRSKAVVPVLVLLFLLCGLFYEAICFMSYLVSFCSCVFQPF